MKTTRYLLATLLLVFSGQSFALFMPAGMKISAEIVEISSDESC